MVEVDVRKAEKKEGDYVANGMEGLGFGEKGHVVHVSGCEKHT